MWSVEVKWAVHVAHKPHAHPHTNASREERGRTREGSRAPPLPPVPQAQAEGGKFLIDSETAEKFNPQKF
jgi:hypothetical protein